MAKLIMVTFAILRRRSLIKLAAPDGDGNYIYQGAVPASESGTYGFSVRVLPTHPCLMQRHELRLITWS